MVRRGVMYILWSVWPLPCFVPSKSQDTRCHICPVLSKLLWSHFQFLKCFYLFYVLCVLCDSLMSCLCFLLMCHTCIQFSPLRPLSISTSLLPRVLCQIVPFLSVPNSSIITFLICLFMNYLDRFLTPLCHCCLVNLFLCLLPVINLD